MPKLNTFRKRERLCSVVAIERLFNGGSRSFSAFPIRIVYRLEEKAENAVNVQLLITVSKRHFHHAVQRNRVKRQIREAYRMHKDILQNAMNENPKALSIAFIWLDDTLWESSAIEKRVVSLLNRVAEKVSHASSDQTIE